MSNLWKSKMEDETLIQRFIDGDKEGFEMLVKRYQNRVINIVYSLTGNNQNADDISQEIFIKVYKHLPAFEKKAEFSTWLYRIAVNTTYTYLKKEKRYLPATNMLESQIAKKGPEAIIDGNEREGIIKQAIERLPFKLRSVIVLKEIEGLSYKDIAQSLGCRIGTVESRLFRARGMLRKILSPILKEA